MTAAHGFIKLHRQIQNSEDWLSEPFTRPQAWIDMLLTAAHKPHCIRIRGIRVDLDRGQLALSEVEYAKRWKWSRGKVRRFLSELSSKAVQRIEQQKDNVTSVVTILNYDTYQGTEQQTGQQAVQQTDSRRTADGHIQEGKEGKEGKKKREYPPESTAVANALLESILSWKPDYKPPSESVMLGWVDACDKAMRLDNRSYERMLEIIKWLPSYEGSGGFTWRVNILSGATLREKFDKLENSFNKCTTPSRPRREEGQFPEDFTGKLSLNRYIHKDTP